jgi:hypothetical protein
VVHVFVEGIHGIDRDTKTRGPGWRLGDLKKTAGSSQEFGSSLRKAFASKKRDANPLWNTADLLHHLSGRDILRPAS